MAKTLYAHTRPATHQGERSPDEVGYDLHVPCHCGCGVSVKFAMYGRHQTEGMILWSFVPQSDATDEQGECVLIILPATLELSVLFPSPISTHLHSPWRKRTLSMAALEHDHDFPTEA